jgi:hypothetical protein
MRFECFNLVQLRYAGELSASFANDAHPSSAHPMALAIFEETHQEKMHRIGRGTVGNRKRGTLLKMWGQMLH